MASGLVSMTQTLAGSGIEISRYALGGQVGSSIIQAVSGWLDLGHPRPKYVDGMILEISEGDQFEQVFYTVEYVEYYRDRESPGVVGPTRLLTEDAYIPLGVVGRFFRITLEDFAPSVQWQWTGVEFYGEVLEGPMA